MKSAGAFDALQPVAQIEDLPLKFGQDSVRHAVEILLRDADDANVRPEPPEAKTIIKQATDVPRRQVVLLSDGRGPLALFQTQQAESRPSHPKGPVRINSQAGDIFEGFAGGILNLLPFSAIKTEKIVGASRPNDAILWILGKIQHTPEIEAPGSRVRFESAALKHRNRPVASNPDSSSRIFKQAPSRDAACILRGNELPIHASYHLQIRFIRSYPRIALPIDQQTVDKKVAWVGKQ